MVQELLFTSEDRIAIVAPHPDDESLGASAALLLAAAQTDIFVLTDGSHGCRERSVSEEAIVRKNQFEAEMAYVKPHSYTWLGAEDTKLHAHPEVVEQIDFTPYTLIFLPWLESLHADHRAAASFCIDTIRRQKACGECFFYEVTAPFHEPSHFIDISNLEQEKRRLIRFHEDQQGHEEIALSLNAFRAAQLRKYKDCRLAECYLKVDM